jgi:23S rRNA (uridine2552-2'-O)-methyltransferase
MKTRTKSKKVNKAWLQRPCQRSLRQAGQKEGYRARAAYKLKEIDETLHLIKPGRPDRRPGLAPGAWSQYVRNRLSPKTAVGGGAAVGALNGTIIALDILPMEPIEGVQFLQGDFREPEVLQRLAAVMDGRQADVVVSDMAPNLSGIESADAARIAHLVELALEFSQAHMKPQGAGREGVPWQRLQPAGEAVQGVVPGRQADQAQGLAGQVLRDLSWSESASSCHPPAAGMTLRGGQFVQITLSELRLKPLFAAICTGLKRLKWPADCLVVIVPQDRSPA